MRLAIRRKEDLLSEERIPVNIPKQMKPEEEEAEAKAWIEDFIGRVDPETGEIETKTTHEYYVEAITGKQVRVSEEEADRFRKESEEAGWEVYSAIMEGKIQSLTGERILRHFITAIGPGGNGAGFSVEEDPEDIPFD